MLNTNVVFRLESELQYSHERAVGRQIWQAIYAAMQSDGQINLTHRRDYIGQPDGFPPARGERKLNADDTEFPIDQHHRVLNRYRLLTPRRKGHRLRR